MISTLLLMYACNGSVDKGVPVVDIVPHVPSSVETSSPLTDAEKEGAYTVFSTILDESNGICMSHSDTPIDNVFSRSGTHTYINSSMDDGLSLIGSMRATIDVKIDGLSDICEVTSDLYVTAQDDAFLYLVHVYSHDSISCGDKITGEEKYTTLTVTRNGQTLGEQLPSKPVDDDLEILTGRIDVYTAAALSRELDRKAVIAPSLVASQSYLSASP
jgi:hypothetical protein